MAKFRVNKTSDYTVISNYHLKERKMSLKSKGLLTLMLSLPDDWNYSLKGLVSLCSESESAVKSSLQELKEFGYLRIQKLAPKKGNGKFEYIYEIFESPLKKEERQRVNKKVENLQLENQPDENVPTENLKVENQPVENLQVENRPNILNTNILNTKELNKETSKSDIDDFINSQDRSEEYKNLLFEFVEYRKKIKDTVKTAGPIKLLLKHFKDEESLKEALEYMDLYNWKTAQPDWIERKKNGNSSLKNNRNNNDFTVTEEGLKKFYGYE